LPEARRVVLGEEAIARPPEFDIHAPRHLARALPGQMDDARCRHLPDLPPRCPDAAAPIHLLGVHEEALVEPAHLLVDRPADQHGRAQRVVDGKGRGIGLPLRPVAPIERRLDQPRVEREQVQEDLGQAGEAEGVALQAAVAVEQARRGHPRHRMRCQERDQRLDGPGLDHGVGVEQ
jgi:hypothetical protein